MDTEFRKDMSHTTWDRVYERQRSRGERLCEWLDALELKPGGRVIDVGCGPGYNSLSAAGRVGPDGLVFALDRSAEALSYLEARQAEQGVSHVVRIEADATDLESLPEPADAALVTMMLHHTDRGPRLLANVRRLLKEGGRAVVAEFHPEGPCDHGPPREHRIDPDTVRGWCQAAGFAELEYRRQTPEHYFLTLRRG